MGSIPGVELDCEQKYAVLSGDSSSETIQLPNCLVTTAEPRLKLIWLNIASGTASAVPLSLEISPPAL